jgi:hypothetical protein
MAIIVQMMATVGGGGGVIPCNKDLFQHFGGNIKELQPPNPPKKFDKFLFFITF